MGKYPPSTIDNWWSDWHKKKCANNAFMTDVDRTWVEIRQGKPVCVWDLKWMWSVEIGLERITWTEGIMMDWYEQKGLPYYIVVVSQDSSPTFQIYRPFIQKEVDGKYSPLATLPETKMIEWIDNGIDFKFLIDKQKLDAFM